MPLGLKVPLPKEVKVVLVEVTQDVKTLVQGLYVAVYGAPDVGNWPEPKSEKIVLVKLSPVFELFPVRLLNPTISPAGDWR